MRRKAWLTFSISLALILGVIFFRSKPLANENIETVRESTIISSDEASKQSLSPLVSPPEPAPKESRKLVVEATPASLAEPVDEAGSDQDRNTHRSPTAKFTQSTEDQAQFLIEDESKFRTWMESYKSLNGLDFIQILSAMRSPKIKQDTCIQGAYEATLQIIDSQEPPRSLKLMLDVCIGESAGSRTNIAELTLKEGTTVSQPRLFPSTGGMPGGVHLIQHEGQVSVLIPSGQDVFQFFFFKSSEQGLMIWYGLDSSLVLSKKGTFTVNKSSVNNEK